MQAFSSSKIEEDTQEIVFLENGKAFSPCFMVGKSFSLSLGNRFPLQELKDISGKRLHGLWESVFINWYNSRSTHKKGKDWIVFPSLIIFSLCCQNP